MVLQELIFRARAKFLTEQFLLRMPTKYIIIYLLLTVASLNVVKYANRIQCFLSRFHRYKRNCEISHTTYPYHSLVLLRRISLSTVITLDH